MNRREVIASLAVASVLPGISAAQTPAPAAGQRQMKPLPFDPAKLKGFPKNFFVPTMTTIMPAHFAAWARLKPWFQTSRKMRRDFT